MSQTFLQQPWRKPWGLSLFTRLKAAQMWARDGLPGRPMESASSSAPASYYTVVFIAALWLGVTLQASPPVQSPPPNRGTVFTLQGFFRSPSEMKCHRWSKCEFLYFVSQGQGAGQGNRETFMPCLAAFMEEGRAREGNCGDPPQRE